VLGQALDKATGKLLELNKSPSRKTGELDNRGSHYYLASYWAEALVAQDDDLELKDAFKALAKALVDNEDQIVKELIDIQGDKVDLGGYFYPDAKKAEIAMRPSATLNGLFS
jgi:isocitrate dehydrogenase